MLILGSKLKMLKNHLDYQVLPKLNFKDSLTIISLKLPTTINNPILIGKKYKNSFLKTVPLESK
jgi:hypothetical protein